MKSNNDGLNPAEFPLGSPESRAAARLKAANDRRTLEVEIISEATMTRIDHFTVTLSSQ